MVVCGGCEVESGGRVDNLGNLGRQVYVGDLIVVANGIQGDSVFLSNARKYWMVEKNLS